MATRLQVDDPSSNPDRVDLRGPVDEDRLDTRFFEILGILIETAFFNDRSFEDFNDNPIGRSEFFNNVREGSIVDVRGELNPAGDRIDAEEVELED